MPTNYQPTGLAYRTILELIQNGELGEDTTFNRPLIQLGENISWIKNQLLSASSFEPAIVKNTGFNLPLATATDIVNGTLTGKLTAANDSRLSDSRLPKAHTHGLSDIIATGTTNGYILQVQAGAFVPVNPISVFPSLPTSFPISSINTLTERLVALDSGLFTTTANVGSTLVRISNLEALNTTVAGSVTSLSIRVSSVETATSTLNLNAASVGIRLNTAESAITNTTSQVLALTSRVSVSEINLTASSVAAAATKASIVTLSATVAGIKQVPVGTITGNTLFLDTNLNPVWRATTRNDLLAIITDLEAKITLAAAPRPELRKEDATNIPLLVGEDYEEYIQLSGNAIYGKYVDIRGLANTDTARIEFFSDEDTGVWSKPKFTHDYTATTGAYTVHDWSYRDAQSTQFLRVRITNTGTTPIAITYFVYAEQF